MSYPWFLHVQFPLYWGLPTRQDNPGLSQFGVVASEVFSWLLINVTGDCRLFPHSLHCRIWPEGSQLALLWLEICVMWRALPFMGLRWWRKHWGEAWKKKGTTCISAFHHPSFLRPAYTRMAITGDWYQDSNRWTTHNIGAHVGEKAVKLEWDRDTRVYVK